MKYKTVLLLVIMVILNTGIETFSFSLSNELQKSNDSFNSDSTIIKSPGKERGDPGKRTKGQLERNRVRTTIQNYGLSARKEGAPISDQTPYEWPKYSGEIYLAMTQLWIGGEIIDAYGNTRYIVDIANGRTSPEGNSWNFEPLSGYYNESKVSLGNFKIANSIDPTSWPEYWPDKMNDITDPGWKNSWNGILGKNKFIKGQELYYRMSDDKYDRYSYFPDSTDLSRKGLGLIIECRAMEFDEYPFEDIVFQHYKIINDGTKYLPKLGLLLWIADFVGGDGDSQDDKFCYDLKNNLVIAYDSDNKSWNFNGNPLGCFGIAYLKTPLSNSGIQLGLTSLRHLWAGSINLYNDYSIWETNMHPGIFDDTTFTVSEYDLLAGSSYFALDAGQNTEFLTATIFANGPKDDLNSSFRISEVKRKLKYAKFLTGTGFNPKEGHAIILNPSIRQTYSHKIDIRWNHDLGSVNIQPDIFLSTDFGTTWNYVGTDSTNSGKLQLDANKIQDGILNKIKIFVYNDSSYSLAESNEFTINKVGQNVPPQIVITSPKKGQIIENTFPVEWISGDADGDTYTTELYYRLNSNLNWTLLKRNIAPDISSYDFDTKTFPNTNEAEFKAVIISGTDTVSNVVTNIEIKNYYNLAPDTLLEIKKYCKGNGIFEAHIINKDAISGDDYRVVFNTNDKSELFYNVFNLSKNKAVINKASEVNGILDGPYFDGMRLFIKADSDYYDDIHSRWNNQGIASFVFDNIRYGNIVGKDNKADYQIVFSDQLVGKSKPLNFRDHFFPGKDVNFNVYNTTQKKPIEFGFMEVDGNDGKLSAHYAYKDRIVFLENVNTDTLEYTYWVYVTEEEGKRFPTVGDTLYIYQHKSFLSGDSIYFSTKHIVDLLGMNEKRELNTFRLEQNYPNPFNPATTISYTIPERSVVEIKLYNILGQELSTLIKKEQNTGKYDIQFTGNDYPSGIYFYRIKAGNFNQVKKMILLK